MICALLLGREGSSGFPGKNVYPVLGRPLVAYPLLAANGASSVDRVDLSTATLENTQIDLQTAVKLAELHGAVVDVDA